MAENDAELPNSDADEAARCYCGGIFSRDNPGDPFVCSRCGTRMRLAGAYSKDKDFEEWMDSATPPCELRGGVRWYSEDGLRKAFDAGAMVERERHTSQSKGSRSATENEGGYTVTPQTGNVVECPRCHWHFEQTQQAQDEVAD